MRIAVASNDKMVSNHFGHCENFNFFEIVDGKILESKFVENPGHDCKGLPSFLKQNNIDVLISGSIGKGAMNNCINEGLEVISGASGLAEVAAVEYEKGNLKSTGKLCDHKH